MISLFLSHKTYITGLRKPSTSTSCQGFHWYSFNFIPCPEAEIPLFKTVSFKKSKRIQTQDWGELPNVIFISTVYRVLRQAVKRRGFSLIPSFPLLSPFPYFCYRTWNDDALTNRGYIVLVFIHVISRLI